MCRGGGSAASAAVCGSSPSQVGVGGVVHRFARSLHMCVRFWDDGFMPQIEDTFTPALVAALTAVEAVPADLATVKSLDDAALLNAQRMIAAISKAFGPAGSLVAGEVAYRSRRE